MIRFEKVSKEQYIRDCIDLGRTNSEDELAKEWEEIKLPERSTVGSAGYDFFAPFSFSIPYLNSKVDTVTICTGIRFVTDRDLVLVCVPRSGQGFNCGVSLTNTVGVIDRDYAQSDNEGHIKAKLTATLSAFTVKKGQGYMQGLLLPYYVVDGDQTTEIRNGGFGSTDRR